MTRIAIRTSTTAKAMPEVAEHLVGDLPLAVPLQGGPVASERAPRRHGARPGRRSGSASASIFCVEGGQRVDRALALRRPGRRTRRRPASGPCAGWAAAPASRSARASSPSATAPPGASTRSERRRSRLARSAAERRTRTGTGSREAGTSRRPTSRPAPGPASVSTAGAGRNALEPGLLADRAHERRASRGASERVVHVHDARRRLEEAADRPRQAPRAAAASGRRSRPPACRARAARAGSRSP